MEPSQCLKEPWLTKSCSAEFQDQIGLFSSPGLFSFQGQMSTHFPGREGNSQRNQHSVRPSTNLKVDIKNQGEFQSNIFLTIISGQTLKSIGIWLRSEVFTHGQLYVAVFRVGKPESLKFAVKMNVSKSHDSTSNIVFKEVLSCDY